MKNNAYFFKIKSFLMIMFSVCIIMLSLSSCDMITGTSNNNNNTDSEIYSLTLVAHYSDEDITGNEYYRTFSDDASVEAFLDDLQFHFDYGYINCGYYTEKDRGGILAFDGDGLVTDEFKQYILTNKPNKVSIYRECDPADATLTLVYEGGTETHNVKMYDVFNMEDLIIPEKYGYKFLGWSVYEDGSLPSSTIMIENFESVYYAKHVPFDVRVALYDSEESSYGTNIVLQYDSHYKLKFEERDGYNFVGYFSDKDGQGTQFTDKKGDSLTPLSLLNETDNYSERIKMYSHYVTADKHTVTLDNDNLINSFTVTYMDAYGKETRLPVSRSATEAKRFEYVYPHDIPKGYYFAGWYEDYQCSKKYDFSQTLTSDITLYPYFKKMPENVVGTIGQKNDEIIFSANSSASTTRRYAVAEDAILRIVVHSSISSGSKKEVYFNVYNSTNGLSLLLGTLVDGATASSVSDIKVKAGDVLHLSAETNGDPISVYFEFSGFTEPEGSYADIPKSIEFDVTNGNHYTLKVYQKFGMEFKGYYTEPNGNGTRCTDENGASLDTYEFASDVKLYPYYEPITETEQ